MSNLYSKVSSNRGENIMSIAKITYPNFKIFQVCHNCGRLIERSLPAHVTEYDGKLWIDATDLIKNWRCSECKPNDDTD